VCHVCPMQGVVCRVCRVCVVCVSCVSCVSWVVSCRVSCVVCRVSCVVICADADYLLKVHVELFANTHTREMHLGTFLPCVACLWSVDKDPYGEEGMTNEE
jgi:hypothetical protein